MSNNGLEERSFQLISNSISYGHMPYDKEEVEQRVYVSSSGQVGFTARNYSQYNSGEGFCREKQVDIGKWKAEFLIHLVESVSPEKYLTDPGSWELSINDANGRETLSGSLIGHEGGYSFGKKPVSVTRIMRRYIPVYGLWAFDRNLSPDYEGKKAIFLFTERWIPFFSSDQPNTYDFDAFFGEECTEQGFQMDCGNEFEARYPGCFNYESDNDLANLIDGIVDVDLLGSAVFSQWRYMTHWALAFELNKDACNWFLLVLRRMRELVKAK